MERIKTKRGEIQIHDIGIYIVIRNVDEFGHNTDSVFVPKDKIEEFIDKFKREGNV